MSREKRSGTSRLLRAVNAPSLFYRIGEGEMVLPGQTGVQVLADTPVSDLLEQWIGEQLERADAARGPRPRIGVLAASGTLRDGGWPVYGSHAPTAHAILEAGGTPRLPPALPSLGGHHPLHLLPSHHP